jgi:hypothetical protein
MNSQIQCRVKRKIQILVLCALGCDYDLKIDYVFKRGEGGGGATAPAGLRETKLSVMDNYISHNPTEAFCCV